VCCRADVGELILSLIVVVLFWPAFLPSVWREGLADRLALTIAAMLAIAGILGLVQLGINLT
jgi:hypothetical protein